MTTQKIRGFEIAKGWENKFIDENGNDLWSYEFNGFTENGSRIVLKEGFEPQRATFKAAGYDIKSIEDITIPSIWKNAFKFLTTIITNHFKDEKEKEEITNIFKPVMVHTGVKAYMLDDEGLFLYNRSSNPLKRGLILTNGVGVGDADYYSCESNDGEYSFQFINILPFDLTVKKGEKIGQGVFKKFLTTDNDTPIEKRTGGHGSTTKAEGKR